MDNDYSAFVVVDITSYPHQVVDVNIETIVSNQCCFLR